jgi:hypothetical protein
MKQCRTCKEYLERDQFHKNKTTNDGLQSNCKVCQCKAALPNSRRSNKLKCYAEGEYISFKHPFHIPGGRFKTKAEWYAKVKEVTGFDVSPLLKDVPPEEPKTTKGFVYVIYNLAWDGWYKVGKADDIEKRLRGYQTGDPHRAYKVCYEMAFDNCYAAEQTILDTLQNDDKVIKKNEWVVTSLDRIRNIINEVKREEASSGHRDELDSQFDMVLCN